MTSSYLLFAQTRRQINLGPQIKLHKEGCGSDRSRLKYALVSLMLRHSFEFHIRLLEMNTGDDCTRSVPI
jgi:hypothetical protein